MKLFGRSPPPPIPFELEDFTRQGVARNIATIRAHCDNAYLGGGTSLCRVLGRYKMYVDSRDFSISSHLILDGYWELWVTRALAGMVRPGMVVADVGANLGYFTLLMADLCGPTGRVHAFEPNPAMVERLVRSVTVNGFRDRVTIHGEPLGDEDGRAVVLHVPPGQPGGAWVEPVEVVAPDIAAGLLTLGTRRLDGIAGLDALDLVKIDAETAEEAIWRGMSGILAHGRPLTILLEFALCRYAEPAAFLEQIAAAGFSLAYIDEHEGVRPATREEILARRPDDEVMLVLRR